MGRRNLPRGRLYQLARDARERWEKFDAPIAINNPAGGVIGSLLYIAGGNPSGSVTGLTYAIDPATNTWTAKATKPTAVHGSSCAVENGQLWCLGGAVNGNVATNICESYNPSTNTWTTRAVTPNGDLRYTFGVTDVAGRILYGNAPTDGRCFWYDPASNTHTQRADNGKGGAYGGVGFRAPGGLPHVVGGYAAAPATSCTSYDPGTNTWTAKAAPPSVPWGIYTNGVGYLEGQFHFIGTIGWTHYAYNPTQNRWRHFGGTSTETPWEWHHPGIAGHQNVSTGNTPAVGVALTRNGRPVIFVATNYATTFWYTPPLPSGDVDRLLRSLAHV